MEIWNDFETSNYYLLNKSEGLQEFCNKFGETPVLFKPYSTGYQNCRIFHEALPDSNYRVQPNKFDGYFQCPRPSSHVAGTRTPYVRDNRKYVAKRLPDCPEKLPKPVSSLSFSCVYDKHVRSPLARTITPGETKLDTSTYSIADVKKQMKEQKELPERNVKTAHDIFRKHRFEMKNIQGYVPPPQKDEKRKLKGMFLVNYRTSNELFCQEKKMLDMTNPTASSKQRRFEATDLKNLRKRREQRILKNKLIQG